MVKYPIGAKIAARRREIGVSQQALADAVGMRQASIADIEAGKVKRPGKLMEIAAALRTSQEWLIGGEGPPEAVEDTCPDARTSRPMSGILEIDVRAGMGGGGLTDGREVVHNGRFVDPVKDEAWHFPASFLRDELRAPERRIQILETQGDSMAPTIMSGDRVIIDTGHTTPSPDGIYAIRDRFGAIVVKRLQVLRRGDPPIIRIISDNRAHDSEDVGVDEIQIFGRVLWGLKRL